MTDPSTRQPWDDDRLAAAFATRAGSVTMPSLLVDATIRDLRAPAGRSRPRPGGWRLLSAAAVVLLVVVGSVGIGARLLPNAGGPAGGLRVLDGPTPELQTLEAAGFAFEFPTGWLAYDSTAYSSGGSSIAVLGTQAVEPRCGDVRHVEINCVYEQRLEPGDIRVFVGTGGYRGGSVLDRADIENGTTTRHTVAGLPAILDVFDIEPDSYYREDLSLLWSIGQPGLLSNVVTIEVRAREDDSRGRSTSVVGAAQAATEALIASFRFTDDARPSATPTGPPATEALGLPVISVVEALHLRDAGVDDREIAVRGWYAPYDPVRACGLVLAPPEQPVSPLQAGCSDQTRFLMQDPEAVFTASGLSWRSPKGPAISPYLREVDLAWAGSDDVERLVELVVVGHFDDRRSFACPADGVDACRDRLVVDRIVSVDGRDVAAIALDQTGSRATSTAAEVEATVLRWAPRAQVLSMVAVYGETGLQGVEPSIGVFAGLQSQRATWVVRVFDAGVLGTYLVIDGSDAVFTIDADNVATQVAGALPVPSPGPWPPEGATVIELTNGEGRLPARAAVVDLSGQLIEARARTADDGSSTGLDDGLVRDPTVNHRYRLRWTTTICDREMTVTIHPNVERILIEHAPRDGCDAMAVGRELILEFARDLDPADVSLEVVPAEILPEPPPEPTTMIVELIRGDAVEEIVVVDHAGSLMEARPADLADVPADIQLAGGTRLARIDDGGTVVLWDGGLCDRDISITIEADDLGPPDRIIVRSGRSAPCRLALVQRAIWLDLGPVNVSTIVARHDVSVVQ